MTTNFDNALFLKNLVPNVEQLNRLESQRNWVIGISIVVILPLAFYAYQTYKVKSELAEMKNKSPLPPAGSATI